VKRFEHGGIGGLAADRCCRDCVSWWWIPLFTGKDWIDDGGCVAWEVTRSSEVTQGQRKPRGSIEDILFWNGRPL